MADKVYDLEERTYLFARDVRAFVKKLEKTITNVDDIRLKEAVELKNILGSIYQNRLKSTEAEMKTKRKTRFLTSEKN